MIQAMDHLLDRNLQTLKEVKHLLPPQSLSYLSLLMLEMVELHLKKAAGYSGLETQDTWRNFRGSERIGVPTWLGVLNRKGDKVSRYENLARDASNDLLGNESLRTTLRDDSAYGLITICLLDEVAAAYRLERVFHCADSWHGIKSGIEGAAQQALAPDRRADRREGDDPANPRHRP